MPLLLSHAGIAKVSSKFEVYSRQDALSPVAVLRLVVLQRRAGTPKLSIPRLGYSLF